MLIFCCRYVGVLEQQTMSIILPRQLKLVPGIHGQLRLVQGQLGQLVQLTCLMEYHEYISKLRFFPQYVIVLSLKSIVDHSVIVCR